MNKMKSLLGALLLLPSVGWCLQTVTLSNHEKQDIQVSDTDYNRLFVKDDRIQSVKGILGQYQLESDAVLGDVYIMPVESEPFNLFITTERKKTIQVRVHPKPLQAETIQLVIQEPEVKAPIIIQEDWVNFSIALEQGTGIPHANIKNITTASYKPLHNGLQSKITRLISQYPWQGEIYTLKNPTKKALTLRPQDYYTPNTVSVTLSHQVIKPHQEVTLTKVVKHG